MALILWGRSLCALVKVVTAFTLVHSLTLCLAVLDIVRLPSSVVEPLIAATLVFVAAENFFVHDISKRWRATFVLGLVHGFGFAGALREYGIPTDAVAPALAAFNIGVEIGQVAIVCLIFPLPLLSDRLGGGAARCSRLRRSDCPDNIVVRLGFGFSQPNRRRHVDLFEIAENAGKLL